MEKDYQEGVVKANNQENADALIYLAEDLIASKGLLPGKFIDGGSSSFLVPGTYDFKREDKVFIPGDKVCRPFSFERVREMVWGSEVLKGEPYDRYGGDVIEEDGNLVLTIKSGGEGKKEKPWWLQKSVFKRNRYGHFVLEFEGLDLTGEQEINRLTARKFRVSDEAKSCFMSTKKDGYDKNHRLVVARYKVALVPMKEIMDKYGSKFMCTTHGLDDLGVYKYRYEKPLAGVVPRICELVSGNQIEEMGSSILLLPMTLFRIPSANRACSRCVGSSKSWSSVRAIVAAVITGFLMAPARSLTSDELLTKHNNTQRRPLV